MPEINELTRLKSVLFAESVDKTWVDCLANLEESESGERQSILDWIRSMRSESFGYLEEVADLDDIEFSIGIQFIELKSRWIKKNTMIQYQLFRYGKAESTLTYKASVLSYLIQAYENSMVRPDVDRINEFLAEPIKEA